MIMTLRKVIGALVSREYWMRQNLLWCLSEIFRPLRKNKSKLDLSIVIYTYIHRYDSCFKRTAKRISGLFPDEQKLVLVNGYFVKDEQEEYLKKIRLFCSRFKNLCVIAHVEPVSLAKLANQGIIHSNSGSILAINDDTQLGVGFRRELLTSGILATDITVINGSWGYTFLKKSALSVVGWLDERLIEMGGEDDDYAVRCAIAGINVHQISMKTIRSSSVKRKKRIMPNSWGKLMFQQKGGYSTVNHEYLFEKKWETSNIPFDGATYVPNRTPKYWKLRPGMETPDFYPESGFLEITKTSQ